MKAVVAITNFSATFALLMLALIAIPHHGRIVAVITSIGIGLLLASPFLFSAMIASLRIERAAARPLWPVLLFVSVLALATYVGNLVLPAHFNVLHCALATPVHWTVALIGWARWTSQRQPQNA